MNLALQTTDLRIAVPGRVLLDDCNWSIQRGEFIAVLGGNGAGKSLLLRTLAGLRAPDMGSVALAGQHMQALHRRDVARQLGFLPQDPEATPQGSVHESVLLGRFAHLGFWDREGVTDQQRVTRALHDVGLTMLATRELASLSGGEQRRVAIARLLVQAPSVYLLDEPTNHLDPAQQLNVLQGLRDLTRAGATVIASLHEPNLALRFADRIALLAGSGIPQLIETPQLGADHLAQLYGLKYLEGRIGAQRLMTPD